MLQVCVASFGNAYADTDVMKLITECIVDLLYSVSARSVSMPHRLVMSELCRFSTERNVFSFLSRIQQCPVLDSIGFLLFRMRCVSYPHNLPCTNHIITFIFLYFFQLPFEN